VLPAIGPMLGGCSNAVTQTVHSHDRLQKCLLPIRGRIGKSKKRVPVGDSFLLGFEVNDTHIFAHGGRWAVVGT